MNDRQNSVARRAALVLPAQSANPIVLGDTGIWWDGTHLYWVLANGTLDDLLATSEASPTLTTPLIKDGLTASGSASNDFSASTGTFKTSTGDNSIGGSGGKAGFLGATPAARPANYTQTYATAARTVPNATSHAITDSSTGSASTSVIAAITEASTAGSADTVPVKNAIATLAAELALVKADLLAAKQLINSLIDDGQTYGLLG